MSANMLCLDVVWKAESRKLFACHLPEQYQWKRKLPSVGALCQGLLSHPHLGLSHVRIRPCEDNDMPTFTAKYSFAVLSVSQIVGKPGLRSSRESSYLRYIGCDISLLTNQIQTGNVPTRLHPHPFNLPGVRYNQDRKHFATQSAVTANTIRRKR